MALLRLNRHGLKRFLTGHPWIYRGDVADPPADLASGALVRFAGPDGRALGWAAWSTTSQIALRRLALSPDEEDPEAAWLALVEQSVARRADRPPTARLINADADGLPGLVVDRYGGALSVQTLTAAADARCQPTLDRLVELTGATTIALRNDARVRQYEGLPEEKRMVLGDSAEVLAPVGALTLAFNLIEGQKTGGFLDQTDNRLAAARFAHGDTLDLFCYDGGFALQLAAQGLPVLAVDASEPALERLRANADRNKLTVETQAANVFDLLRALEREGRRFDTIILDPPAFARARAHVAAGHRAYKEINLRALKLLRPGGRLITCTCSAHITRPMFEAIVAEAAGDARRWTRVIERRSAAPDHPSLLTAPETDYLKVLFLEA